MKLFGGAIDVEIPNEFCDASDYRDVPDNQELWVGEIDGFTAGFIVELLEPVLPNESLEQAFQEHIKDLHHAADIGIDSIETIETFREQLSHREWMGVTQLAQDPKKGPTFLVFGLFRIEKHQTDIILTCSVNTGNTKLSGPNLDSVINQAKTAVAIGAKSFTVVDPSLFKN